MAYHGSFRENLESAFWALECHIAAWLGRCKSSKKHLWSIAVLVPCWCLSPVRVVYHGSFRENLESAFWGLGVSYHNLIKHMQVFKTEQLKCCSFDASSHSKWLIMAHLERIWSQHFGALECHIAAWLGRCKSSKKHLWSIAVLVPCWCLSPVRVVYYGSFRENLESAFWGLGMSYHNVIKHMQVFKTEQLKCCSFDASSHSKWLIMAHLERIWSQHFGALECHITTWLGRCGSSKRSI